MKEFILTLICSTTLLLSSAQEFDWAKRMGGSNGVGIGTCVLTLDIDHNLILKGYYEGTFDFNPSDTAVFNLTSVGGYDMYISKLDNEGNFLWAKSIGGLSDDIIWGIKTDNFGNIYLVGQFEGTVDFNPSDTAVFELTSSGLWEVFVLKLNTNGEFIWAKKFGGTGSDIGLSIDIDASGNIYTTGYFSGSANFGTDTPYYLNSLSGTNTFILKLDTDGNFIWAESFEGGSGSGDFISLDIMSNVYITGNFSGTTDFNPSELDTFNINATGTYADIFVSKLDSNGNFIWAKSFEGNDYGVGRYLILNEFNNVYFVGYFRGTVNFSTGSIVNNHTSVGNGDIIILKFDSDGDVLWSKQIGGVNNDNGYSIKLDEMENVYIAGSFQSTVDFNPSVSDTFNITSAGAYDIFLSKLDANGTFIWALSMGGIGVDAAHSIIIDTNYNIYTSGNFHSIADFNPSETELYNLVAEGDFDIFVHKMSQSTIGINEIYRAELLFNIFPIPTQTLLSISVNFPTDISIFTISGQELMSLRIQNNKTIDVSKFVKGIYFIKELTSGKVIKFVKN